MVELSFYLALVLSFLFGWNNSSFLIGNLRGAGLVSLRGALSVSIIGLLVGVFLEGSKMATSLSGLASGTPPISAFAVTLTVSVLLTLILSLMALPVSFSVVMVGAFLGASYSFLYSVDLTRTASIVGFWFVAPLLTALGAYLIYNSMTRFVADFSLVTVDALNRAGAFLSALAVSYSLGANNIGLILSAVGDRFTGTAEVGAVVLLTLFASIGVAVLGKGAVSGTVGDKMLSLSPQGVFTAFISSAMVVWIGTQLAIPVSISQCVLGGMFGAALAKNVAVLNRRIVFETVSLWIVAPIVAFAAALIIAPVMHTL